VRAAKFLLVGIIALLVFSGDLGQSAFASHHKRHVPKSQKYHYKPDKNAYMFGGKYKTPKKQHYPKSSYGKAQPQK
jgi:hypothetical protein